MLLLKLISFSNIKEKAHAADMLLVKSISLV